MGSGRTHLSRWLLVIPSDSLKLILVDLQLGASQGGRSLVYVIFKIGEWRGSRCGVDVPKPRWANLGRDFEDGPPADLVAFEVEAILLEGDGQDE